MIRKILRENETLREMFVGIGFYGLVIGIILAAFFPLKIYREVGLLAGILCAMGMAVHMAWCLEKIVSLDEKGARNYAKKTTLIRYAFVCLVLLAIAYTKAGDPVTMVLGTLGLKIGAYLQPLVHKILHRSGQKTVHDDKEGE